MSKLYVNFATIGSFIELLVIFVNFEVIQTNNQNVSISYRIDFDQLLNVNLRENIHRGGAKMGIEWDSPY